MTIYIHKSQSNSQLNLIHSQAFTTQAERFAIQLAGAFADGLALELVEDADRDVDQILVNGLGAVDGISEGNGDDLVAAQGGHLTELAAVSHVNRADAVSR